MSNSWISRQKSKRKRKSSTCTARKLRATPSHTRGTVFGQEFTDLEHTGSTASEILSCRFRTGFASRACSFSFLQRANPKERQGGLVSASRPSKRNHAPTRNPHKNHTFSQTIHRRSHSIARMRAQITLTFSMRALRADMSNLSSSLHTPSRCMSTRVLAQVCAVQRHARDRVDATPFRAICSLHALLASNRALKVRATLFWRAEGMRTLGPAEAQPLPACQDQ